MKTRQGILIAALVLAAGGALAWAQDKGDPKTDAKPAEQPATETKPVAPASSVPTPTTPPAEANPGRELFLAAQDVVKRAQAITYHSKSYSTGALESMMTKSQADVRMLRGTNGKWLIRSTGSGDSNTFKDAQGNRREVEIDVGLLESTTEWVDNEQKKVIEKIKPKGDVYRLGDNSRMDELFNAVPFGVPLGPNVQYEMEERREEGGVMCDVVVVVMNKGNTHTRWFLGVDDHLPRRREGLVQSTAYSGAMIVELSNVHVDFDNPPALTRDMMRVTVPEGYTEEREQPPPPPAPPPATPVGVKGEPPAAKQPEPVEPAQPSKPEPPPAPVIVRAPDFTLSTPAGDKVTLASLKGNPAVIEFAGSWCLQLRDAHPELEALHNQYKARGVKVYMIDVREKSEANIVEDLRKGTYTFGVLVKGDDVARQFGIQLFPTYCVVDKDGLVTLTQPGYTKTQTMAAVQQAVEAALGNAPAAAGTSPATPATPVAAPVKESPAVTKPKVEKKN